MTTQRSEADEAPTLADRVMRPGDASADQAETVEPAEADHVALDDDAAEPPAEPAADHTADHTADRNADHAAGADADDATDDTSAVPATPTTGSSSDTAPPEPEDEPVSVDQTSDHADRTETQVLPTAPGDDDAETRVVPAVTDDRSDARVDDPTATRPMPVVEPEDGESVRSTDRDAARARAEARYRPADDAYENLYAPTSQATPAPVGFAGVAAAESAPAEPQVIRRIVRGKPTTDKFHAAFALFVLRVVVAAIAGAHGAQKLLNLTGTREFFAQTQIPYPEWAALATGIGEVLIAGALLIGLLVRVAGFGLLVVSVGALVFVQWAPFTLLRPDVQGFVGEKELVLAAVGLLFLLLGGGGWGADRMFRSAKSKGLVEEDET